MLQKSCIIQWQKGYDQLKQIDYYGHENEMYNVGVEVKEVECL